MTASLSHLQQQHSSQSLQSHHAHLCSCTMFFFFTHQRSEMAPTSQLLRSAEALTMPGVQVIVLNANMRCLDCRDRVSKVLSKMDNLLNYVVDVTQKKVTVRGRVDPKKRIHRIRLLAKHKKRKAVEFERAGEEGYPSCSSDYLEQNEYCTSAGWKVKSTDNLTHEAGCFCCASS